MPKNEDFEYEGLSVEHAKGWNANNYHQRQGVYSEKKDTSKDRIQPQPLGELKNVVRPQRDVVTPQVKAPEGKQTNIYDVQLENAKAKDWRTRGLTQNKIIDN